MMRFIARRKQAELPFSPCDPPSPSAELPFCQATALCADTKKRAVVCARVCEIGVCGARSEDARRRARNRARLLRNNLGVFPRLRGPGDASLRRSERVADLVGRVKTEEVLGLLVNGAKGIDRLWLPPHNWWSEALHGVQSGCAQTHDGSSANTHNTHPGAKELLGE